MSGGIHSRVFLPYVPGIRALAIMGVLFYHISHEYCPAGYFGVDVFLVISGYFLFRSLMNEAHVSDFHYGHYLLNKAWRILPSWFVCCVVVVLASAFFMAPRNSLLVIHTAMASSLSIADYRIDGFYDYFNDYAELNSLLHLWYLSIIVQFFVVAPLLLMPFLRSGSGKYGKLLIFIVGVVSLIYYVLTTSSILLPQYRSQLLSYIGARNAYYHLFPRLWELVAGYCILWLPSLENRRSLRTILALLGVAGIICSYFIYGVGSPNAYLAVMSTMLLIRYAHDGICFRLLTWKPLLWIGTISFSLYLWHWPIITLWKYFCFSSVPLCDELIMVFLSLLFGYAAWRWVERYSGPPVKSFYLRALSVLACILVMLTSSLLLWWKIRRLPLADFPDSLLHFPGKAGPRDAALLRGYDTSAFPCMPIYCGSHSQSGPSFLLLGDSHSLHLYPGLHRACTEQGICGIALNSSVVPTWGRYEERWSPQCEKALLQYLERHPEIEYVLVSLLWSSRLWGGLDSCEQGHYAEHFADAWEILRRSGKQVILLADTPFFTDRVSPYEKWERVQMFGRRDVPVDCITIKQHREHQREANNQLQTWLDSGLACAVIDLSVPLEDDGKFPSRREGKFLYSDCHHLTAEGSRIVGKYLASELSRIVSNDGARE